MGQGSNDMKGQKAIGIFILGIIVIAYLVISNQPFLLSILTPSEYLSYNDLTAEEIESVSYTHLTLPTTPYV